MIVYKVPQYFLDAMAEQKALIKALEEKGRPIIETAIGREILNLDHAGRLLFTIRYNNRKDLPEFVRFDKSAGAYTVRLKSKEGKQLVAKYSAMLKEIGWKHIDLFFLFKSFSLNMTYKIDTVQGVKCFVVYDGLNPAKEGWEPIEV